MYRYNANVVRQINQNIENARQGKAFELWTPNWVRFVERNVGAWMHIEHILGLYVFAACNRSGPTNMHNTAMVINSEHKIRFAQDLALYNLTLSEEIDGFDGAAHIDAWNNDAEWQGARKVAEALTAVQDDWGESIFATNVVFEPLIGELFRSNLVMQSAAGNGDFVTPTVMGAGEYDYAQRDLRWTGRVLRPAHPRQASSPTTTSSSCRGGCPHGCRRCSTPRGRCSRCGPSPTTSRPGSRTRSTRPRTGSPGSSTISVSTCPRS